MSFRLHGRRYPGLEFHFVKTRTDWLAFLASPQEAPLIPAPPRYAPMLAEGGWEAFDDPSVVVRAEVRRDPVPGRDRDRGDGAARRGPVATSRDQYPELRMIHELVDQVNAVIDGEIVALDESGKDSFEALQQRMNLRNAREIDRIKARIPVSLVVFDVLWLDGRETTGLPLEQRRELLGLVVETDERLQIDHARRGRRGRFTEGAKALGLEGVVAKRLGSPYVPGRRTDAWRKIKLVPRRTA